MIEKPAAFIHFDQEVNVASSPGRSSGHRPKDTHFSCAVPRGNLKKLLSLGLEQLADTPRSPPARSLANSR
jgi:hypothetical protein